MSIVVLIASDFALDTALEARWLQDLPASRQAELARWPHAPARHQSLTGTRLLREGLKRLGVRHPCLASLRYPPRSRPTLDLPFDFSVSHCDGRVVCAVSSAGPVGIDVEALGPLVAADFPSYLNPAERLWAGNNTQRFYSIWTRKEAVIKAAGRHGLAELRQVDTQSAAAGAAFAGQAWQTAAIPVGIAYVAHLACGVDRQLPSCLTVEHISGKVLAPGGSSGPGALPRANRPLILEEQVYCK
jgi:4'-phosphopantetheinyl transferase